MIQFSVDTASRDTANPLHIIKSKTIYSPCFSQASIEIIVKYFCTAQVKIMLSIEYAHL